MLPFCNLALHAQKPHPPTYPREPKTIGEHIKKRRMDLKLTQLELAKKLGVVIYTVRSWEQNETSPRPTMIPKVVEFLGYNPFCETSDMSEGERIRSARKLLGLTQQEAAKQLGICPTTLSTWETGKGIRKKSYWKVLEPFITASNAGNI